MRKLVVPALALALLMTAVFAARGQAPAAAAASAPDAERGRQAYAMCATCHGARGEGQPAIDAPALGGQLPSYIERQLKDYRAGLRGMRPDDVPGNRMRMLARSIPDDALLADVAAHIGRLPAARSDRAVVGNVAVGRTLYSTHCAACHGARAEGQAALNAPRLAGLGDQYTLSQLRHYKLDRRAQPGNALGQQMTQLTRATLKDDRAMRDVVAHLSSLAR